MNRLHQRYGPVVRFGPTDLSYTAADAWQDIHGLVKGQPENPKALEFSVQPVNDVSNGYSADRVDQRLREGSNQPDVWALVAGHVETPDTKLSLKEMHSNAELFMLAGSETTGTYIVTRLIPLNAMHPVLTRFKATLLSGAIYLLLTHSDAMIRLSREIRTKFRREKDIAFSEVATLPYLNACLKETSRVYPAVPIGSPRVVPEGGKSILGRWIPPETRVAVHHYATYHAEANFKEAETFVPERWLGDPRYADDNQAAHGPFGWGHRNCV
ncbi:Cytochrome P450 monooxygenase FUM2 [Apiospora phragmitis]|uniref:Cytochrome P450 monooxygenase FUM2 n=1 Tax=Apiospora phragmitis TaxID=2905665 RepID=A0ABR1UJG4_9PEZI